MHRVAGSSGSKPLLVVRQPIAGYVTLQSPAQLAMLLLTSENFCAPLVLPSQDQCPIAKSKSRLELRPQAPP